jgi:nucleotide-binding universal stress UspA family protein
MSIFPTKILLATDGSEQAELASRTAADIANSTNSELHVIAVGPVLPEHFEPSEVEPAQKAREARELLDNAVQRIESGGGKIAQAHLKFGGAAEEIVNLGEEIEAGLIVVGNRGRRGLRRALMGSVSDSVVRHAHCPVLVVRKEKQ